MKYIDFNNKIKNLRKVMSSSVMLNARYQNNYNKCINKSIYIVFDIFD